MHIRVSPCWAADKRSSGLDLMVLHCSRCWGQKWTGWTLDLMGSRASDTGNIMRWLHELSRLLSFLPEEALGGQVIWNDHKMVTCGPGIHTRKLCPLHWNRYFIKTDHCLTCDWKKPVYFQIKRQRNLLTVRARKARNRGPVSMGFDGPPVKIRLPCSCSDCF